MAITDRKCIGTSSTSGGAGSEVRILHGNSAAQPFYPSIAGQNTSQVRMLEFFWFLSTDITGATELFTCKVLNSGSVHIHRFYFSGGSGTFSTTLNYQLNDADGNSRIITVTGMPIAANLNVWWHTVVYREAANAFALWRVRHGRVGLTVAGTPSTADSWPYSFTATGAATAGADDRMRGFRAVHTDACTLGFGGRQSNFAGTTISSTTRWRGGFAEFRVWQDNLAVNNPTGPDGLMDNRDRFIDAETHPNLIHCFRFNENSTSPLDFDDVGFQNARFATGTVQNHNFASSPIPNQASSVENRIGAYKVQTFPAPIARVGEYRVRRIFQPERIGAYKVRNTATPTRNGDYKVAAAFSASRDGAYKVGSEATLLRNGQYAVDFAPIADTAQRTGEYRVLTAPTISRSGEYVIGQIPTITRSGQYMVLRSIGQESRTGSYKIATFPAPVTKAGAYNVAVTGSITRSGEYRLVGQTDAFTIQRVGRYVVYNPDFTAALLMRKHAELRSRTR